MNKFKKIILENGIPLYLCVNPSMKNYFVSYNVLYGSSGLWFNFDDKTVSSGYAHYLEHLLGEHSKYGNLYDNLGKRLYNVNAYTAHDVTSYHFKGLMEVDKSIEELISAVDEPVFDQKDVDASRHAIEEESASFCDNVGVLVVNLVDNNLYSGFDKFDETLSPIGNRETTRLITLDDLYNCYNAFYTDDRKFLVIAGNVDEEKIVDYLNEIFAKRSSHTSSVVLPNIDFSGVKKESDVIYRKTDTPISSLGVKVKKPDLITMKQFKYCMSIIKDVLVSSKEYNDLNKNGVYDSIEYVFLTSVSDYINLIQSFTTRQKEECYKRLLDLLSKKEISKRDYELSQKSVIASEIRDMDNRYEYLECYPMYYHFSEDYTDIDLYKSTSYEEFMSILDQLDFSEYSVGEVRKLKRKRNI